MYYDKTSLDLVDSLTQFEPQLATLQAAYTSEVDRDPRPGATAQSGSAFALDAVSAYARSALSILSLFRQDTALAGKAFTIVENAFESRVARALLAADAEGKSIELVIPDVMLKGPLSAEAAADNPIKESLDVLFQLRSSARAKKLANLEKLNGMAPAHGEYPARRAYDGLVDAWLAAADALAGAVAAPSGGKPAPVGELAKAANLRTLLRDKDTYVLRFGAGKAVGTVRTRKNLFTTLFTGDLIRFSGGAVGWYQLYDSERTLVDADEVHWVSGYSKFNNLLKATEATNVP